MTHSLTLKLPDSVFKPLAEKAKAEGRSVEDVVIERLAGNESEMLADDPLDRFVGAFNSDTPDWADNHDQYLAQSLSGELRAKSR